LLYSAENPILIGTKQGLIHDAERGDVPRREREGLLPLGGLRVRAQQEHGACRPQSAAT
jgi:hypothetical protein